MTRPARWRRVLAIMLLCATALADGDWKLVAGGAGQSGAKEFAVASGGRIPLTIEIPPAAPPKDGDGRKEPAATARFELTPFLGDAGGELPVSLAPLGDAGAVREMELPIREPVVRLELHVGEFDTDEKFTGTLLAFVNGNRVLSQAITLSAAARPRPAVLVLDRNAITVTHRRSWMSALFGDSSAEPARFSVHVRDKSGKWPLDGVVAQLLDSSSPTPGFDPKRVFRFQFNGKAVPDLWGWPPAGAEDRRLVPADAVARIDAEIGGLPPGEYKATLRFVSRNSTPDDAQKLVVTIQVRDSLFLPALTLLAAVVASFVATRWLVDRRKTAAIEQRIKKLRTEWLRQEPATPPVAWTRAMLRQCSDRCNRSNFLLVGAEEIEETIGEVERLQPILKRVARFRGRIRGLQHDKMVRRRAEKRLRQICADLGAGPIDPKTETAVHAALDKFETWFIPESTIARYAEDLRHDVESLLAAVNPDDLNRNSVFRKRVEELCAALKEFTKPPKSAGDGSTESAGATVSERDAVNVEREYAKLQLLWYRKDWKEEREEFEKLLKGGKSVPVERFFDVADKEAWKRLVAEREAIRPGDQSRSKDGESKTKRGLILTSPRQSSISPYQAYRPLVFEAWPAIEKLGDNYLYKHDLEFTWILDVETDRRFGGEGKHYRGEIRAVTRQPRAVIYGPYPCTLTPRVILRRDSDVLEFPLHEQIVIEEADESRLWAKVMSTEIVSTAIAAVVAVVSGLAAKYFGNATFGGVSDYATLFLWGAGIDQGKNFLQVSASLRGAGASPPKTNP